MEEKEKKEIRSGNPAIRTCEPCQGRKAAAISRLSYVSGISRALYYIYINYYYFYYLLQVHTQGRVGSQQPGTGKGRIVSLEEKSKVGLFFHMMI